MKEVYQNKSSQHVTECSYGSPSSRNADYCCHYTIEGTDSQ